MSRRANYQVVKDRPGEPLYIKDVGPWDMYLTVTNAAEEVVAELHQQGRLPDGRQLFYYDSEGIMDELVHRNGVFTGFAPGPRS